MTLKYRNIAITGKFAVGTTTLAKHLQEILDWNYVNAGAIQREYDRQHNIHENKQGALARPDQHERQIEDMAKKLLETKKNLIYEGWLAGFIAKDSPETLRILLVCSNEAVRIDRVVNRENVSIEEAKAWIKQREEENVAKWKKIYGDQNFWDEKYFHLVIDTYSSGPIQTVGKVLDKIGFRGRLNHKR